MSYDVPEPALSHQAPSPTSLPSSFRSLLSNILICTQFWSEADPRFHLFLSLGRETPAARHHPSHGWAQVFPCSFLADNPEHAWLCLTTQEGVFPIHWEEEEVHCSSVLSFRTGFYTCWTPGLFPLYLLTGASVTWSIAPEEKPCKGSTLQRLLVL